MRRFRTFKGKCETCGKSLCPEHVYSYVDGNNEALTENSPYLCATCYENKYPLTSNGIKNDCVG